MKTFTLQTNQPSETETVKKKVKDPKNPDKKIDKAVVAQKKISVQIDEEDFSKAAAQAVGWLSSKQHEKAAIHPRSGPTHIQGSRVWCSILPDENEHPAIVFITNGMIMTEEVKDLFRQIMNGAVVGSDYRIVGDRMNEAGHAMYFDLDPRAGRDILRAVENFRAGCPQAAKEKPKDGRKHVKESCGCGWYGKARARLVLPEGWR